MSTGVIIAIVIVAAVVLAAVVFLLRARGAQGGPGLKRRFGPEYERTVARHHGDTKAAEAELAQRVERHGSLTRRPLAPEARAGYEARWAAAQERFVDSPREAVAEADRLIAELSTERGFPEGRHEDRIDALSVHHAHHVHGYRRLHEAARTPADGTPESRPDTEELRAAMVEARGLFEQLTGEDGHGTARTEPERTGAAGEARGTQPAWALGRRHVKGS
ncbi:MULTISPECIES: hypothetical protein [Streptomyces]|uniref:Secreted protein n=2 Tax=Streptomyces griseoaurantiacus TaxID=68213 RepID=A0A7W2DTB6_9ACTN|nr:MULTISPECIES: hypothetical protein [Streptomyces]MBA5222589.1 hypothetical protein [Streptomyces griseoaurantiacus]MCF0086269.1 hypothetical protein [Streptomyces sp. MH192]MCF0102023.1 hypothetical protein [Streptomyces sp. MH191]MDX3088975.1 hypothetical protein [Streptomyces sp. ME12-02E]MDX3334566.1 hypothetical protein [Streptomyces sp. ME02-6978a]